ncbi:MAG TPA: ABC transporter permease [Bacteroidales bacterium]|nr:ABC transporter permease [Bacteroidales bacterium]HPS17629.1 ABC transporter permease [Bacteroidales bacterium]
MRLVLFIKLVRESYLFAINSLMVNKLRTILSLLGITIGIFSIISVFTVFDSMEHEIRTNIESLGNNVLFIQKWPWSFEDDYAWWKYMNRPVPKTSDLEEIQKKCTSVEAASLAVFTSKTVEYIDNSIENISVGAVSQDYDKTMNLEIEEGRYFTSLESVSGKNVIIIGSFISENLFNYTDPLGKMIKVFGRKLKVIGVLKKKGEDMFGNSQDKEVYIPLNFARNFLNIESDMVEPMIIVKAKKGISNEELKDEITGIMRSAHKLKPIADDDFSINETSLLTKGFESIFSVISLVGWVIGGFSILVGGFGIANIMFVSVKERTSIIGIKKSLGAKRYIILFEFLFEAIILSLIGGAVGLLLVFTGTLIVSNISDMTFTLGMGNILRGVITSAVIGLVSGFIPAFTASRLNPVEAIRANQ